MPDSVDVLGCRYAVKVEKGHLNQNHAGLHRGFQGEILLDAETGHDQRRVTLVHEILHGLDQNLGTKLDEQQVTAVASGFYAVMRHNPGLVVWLTERP